jgi:ATP-dependent helicase/nuclease subunit A
VPIVDAGDLLRIDRLVAVEEAGVAHWWVLDYKLHSRPQALAEHRDQLARYVAAVQRLQPADVVNGAFITGAGMLVPL